MPDFRKWAEDLMGIDVNNVTAPQKMMEVDPPTINEEFFDKLGDNFSRVSFEEEERMMHSHGHSLQEVFKLRQGKFSRFADVVIYPENTKHVEKVVSLAAQTDVVIIPYGGGTNVTQALMLNQNENRMIISLDMTRMNKIKWVDKSNMTACVEAGIIGSDLEKELKKFDVVCGHEPDSVEFSSLGGWISTKASGMKKNVYGNIEDIVQAVTLVTPTGTFERYNQWPRVSHGPEINHFILGSEGNLGVITEAILRVREVPEQTIYGSIVFPDFENGCKFMREVGRSRIWPASIRLVDNLQFQFGLALKPQNDSKWKEIIDKIKKFYVLKIKGFDPEQMWACILLFEGTKQNVKREQKSVYALAKQYHGMKAGPDNGIRGYFLTFVIAYMRDFACNYHIIAESFEASVPWDKMDSLWLNVKERIYQSCRKRGVKEYVFISSRVTQVYETGWCIYIYFGFNYSGWEDPLEVYEAVEHDARDEILRCGGSLSHHHGVGKIRKAFMDDVVGETGIRILKSVKSELDPNNIFATNNLYDGEVKSIEEKKE
jgi:alkyldihydroxyacetonephosphate synthase